MLESDATASTALVCLPAMQRMIGLHSETTTFPRTDGPTDALASAPASNQGPDAGSIDQGDRPTPVSPFNMEAFAWETTSSGSEDRPSSEPPAQWQSTGNDGVAIEIDLEVEEALAELEGPRAPGSSSDDNAAPTPASDEPPAATPEDFATPRISQHEIEDPSAYVLERYRTGDLAGALDLADVILSENPSNLLVRECRNKARDALAKIYADKLRPLDRAPIVIAAHAEAACHSIDHRAQFLLSHVDGSSSLEAIVDACGMPRFDALKILQKLLDQRIIGFA